MFTWLKARLNAWVKRAQLRKIERLHEEACRLKQDVLSLTGESRVLPSPEERRLLAKKASGIDPELLKGISVLEDQDAGSPSPNQTSPKSP